VGSPDASAGVPKDNFSVEYRGLVRAPTAGSYEFTAEDEVRIDSRSVIERAEIGRSSSSATLELDAGRPHPIAVRYARATGAAGLHLSWSGPTFSRRVLEPVARPEAPDPARGRHFLRLRVGQVTPPWLRQWILPSRLPGNGPERSG
jgi:hypothetical protein